MIVAVVAVGVVQAAVHQVVNVIAVWHGLVAAVGPVRVSLSVFLLREVGRTVCRVGGADFEDVLVNVPLVMVMKMAVVEIINVAVVLDGGVAAIGAVLMRVVFVDDMVGHRDTPSRYCNTFHYIMK